MSVSAYDMCASYSLASSLVEYVTFTTAVSVSVFTAGMTERDKQKHETVHEGAQVHGSRSSQVRRVRFPVVIWTSITTLAVLQTPLLPVHSFRSNMHVQYQSDGN